MERPKRIDSTITGRKDAVGPVWSRPTMPCSQPHSKTATRAPKAASADRPVVRAAFSAITMDRKAIVSTRAVIPTMKSRNSGKRSTSLLAMSSLAAVVPPT